MKVRTLLIGLVACLLSSLPALGASLERAPSIDYEIYRASTRVFETFYGVSPLEITPETAKQAVTAGLEKALAELKAKLATHPPIRSASQCNTFLAGLTWNLENLPKTYSDPKAFYGGEEEIKTRVKSFTDILAPFVKKLQAECSLLERNSKLQNSRT